MKLKRVYRKNGTISLVCRGRVVFNHWDMSAIRIFEAAWRDGHEAQVL